MSLTSPAGPSATAPPGPEDATAFSNRGYLRWLNFAMRWDDPACDGDYMARTRAVVGDLAPWVGSGVYLNMLNFD